jgi:APA family basic amino acid/polyamine antiporter
MTQAANASEKLGKSISLSGAIALVVGGVVGAGIYVLVAQIGAKAGASLWLSLSIAMLVSLIGVIPTIQLAGALPRDGAGYFFSSRMLNPFAGAMVSYWVILGAGASTCVVAVTLADSISGLLALLPFGVSLHVAGMGILFLFWAVFLLGMQLAISLQVIMAIQFVTALIVYALAGAAQVPITLSVSPPAGPGAFFESILLSYMLCMGFQVVAEMGEEIVNARRNIPLALLIGGAIVGVLYITVGQVFVSHFPEASGITIPKGTNLLDTASAILPGWFIPYLAFGAITAGLTSLNAAAIAIPREIFAQSRDGLLPAWLSKVSPRTHAPQHAVTVYFLFVGLLLLAHQEVDFYGVAAAIGILVMSSVLCIASLNLPRRFPEYYRNAYIVFPYPLLVFCTIFSVLVSLFFCGVVLMEQPRVAVVYVAWSLLVAGIYRLRTRGWGEAQWARTRSVAEGE